MSTWVWIIIIVVIVLAIAGYFGRVACLAEPLRLKLAGELNAVRDSCAGTGHSTA